MARRFDFISPGVQLNEIDRSRIVEAPPQDGLVLIGRAKMGPAMEPVEVRSWSDWKSTFGDPLSGQRNTDSWRNGHEAAPNYAAYAAQAYLAAGVGPVKYIRLLGMQSPNAGTGEYAGWTMGSSINTDIDQNASAYGLFLAASASTGDEEATLAAIFYVSGAAVALSGTVVSSSAGYEQDTVVSASTMVVSSGDNCGFTITISSSAGATDYPIDFNAGGSGASRYIRDVLNTAPDLHKGVQNYNNNSNEPYFLGETFDVNINRDIADQSTGKVYGFILGLEGSANLNADDFQQEFVAAKTGWFIGNKTGASDQKKLFRLIALDGGEEFQKNYYCAIKDISLATGTNGVASFSLQIIRRGTNLGNDSVEEEFTGLNFDPNSAGFILKQIGNASRTWNKSTGQFDESGLYPNISRYVRVELASNTGPSDFPMGWVGLKKDAAADQQILSDDTATQGTWFDGESSIPLGNTESLTVFGLHTNYTASLSWPKIRLSDQGSLGSGVAGYAASATYGLRHTKKGSQQHDASFGDIARKRKNADMHIAEGDALSTAAQVFSLDDIKSSSLGATTYYFESGSYDAGDSISKLSGLGGGSGLFGLGIRQFAAPFFGGADGVDIMYVNPFSNARLGTGDADNYPRYSVNQAIRMVTDPEVIRYELISMPGIINTPLTDELMNTVTTRGDALAIVDLDGIYQPTWDKEGAEEAASVSTVVSQIESVRSIDTSYAATYFPTVRLATDTNILQVPPSVAGIGAIAKSEDLSHPWFAPAGFNRGGISKLGGSAGPSIAGVDIILNKNNRDDLYKNNINPIAKFPSTGDLVIFGQKTLQTSHSSALDRINVRRLMIYLKRQIGVIADTILFDQNVQVTWNRFKAQAEAVLSSVQADLGITEYRIVLDETTTTPDLVDRNILYAQIYVKPARSIEFIAIDFIITQSGVEF